MNFRQKTINGLSWSFIENTVSQGANFIIGIILARLLSPEDFGLMGMIAIFIALSSKIVNSGFNQALIQKKECTQKDYSTIFYFNFLTSIILCLLLLISARTIAIFFKEPKLIELIQVVSLVIIINSIAIVQNTIIIKDLNFKLLTKITFLSSMISGIIAIIAALYDFGVWSLVIKIVVYSFIQALLLWVWNKWKPKLLFSFDSLKELFSFGGNLFALAIIDTIYLNIYNVIIGKYYSSVQLGYFTRAENFKNLPSKTLNNMIQRVSFPALVMLQGDNEKLTAVYMRLMKSTSLIAFVVLLGMASVSEEMIVVLIGEKWIQSAEYLRILCFAGMFYPLKAISISLLKVFGESGIILRVGILLKVIAIPIIVIGIFIGVKEMIIGMVFHQIIGFGIYGYLIAGKITLNLYHQVKLILPSFSLALTMAFFVFFLGQVLTLNIYTKLFIEVVIGIIIIFMLLEFFKNESYQYLKNIVIEKYKNKSDT